MNDNRIVSQWKGKLIAEFWKIVNVIEIFQWTLQALFRHIIGGLCYWYVDDLMAVSPKALYVNNSSLLNSNVQQLLGVAHLNTIASPPKRNQI